MSQNHETDPNAADHRAKVDAILRGEAPTSQAEPAKPAPARASTASAVEGVQIPGMIQIEGSAQIAERGHDPATCHLFLRFHGRGGARGALYRYGGFGLTDYAAFCDADSPGGYFAKVIKANPDRYPCERVVEA